MNNHKMACVLLLVLIAGIVFGTQKMRHQAMASKDAADAAKISADGEEMQRRIAESNLRDLDKKTAELRETYRGWLPYFEGIRSPEQGEQRIADLVRSSKVFLLSQRFEIKEISSNSESLVRKALKADLVFEDDYAKTLNWLGHLEESIPSCQVTRCRLTRGDRDNNIRLELTVTVPILNRTAASPKSEPEVASL